MIDASAIIVLAYACLGVAGLALIVLTLWPAFEDWRIRRRQARRGGMLR